MPFKKNDERINRQGRPAGSKNKVNEELREALSNFLSGEFESIKKDFKKLRPKDKLKFFTDVLPYVVPRLQNTSLDIDFERLPDDQLDELLERIKKEALQHYENDADK
ncbi:MAG: hypothetical protein EKK37_00805 [Sphingobacteriales bacterium]|nr:MAG: hypothetical protein EKK37_00805 [Sphingobacteriales bacterium]